MSEVTSEDRFAQPATVDAAEMVFGGKMSQLLPPYASIPDEFKDHYGQWNKLASGWFFGGLPKGTAFIPKDGIDAGKAVAHLRAILVSFEPKHEHKEAGVAYLMSKWFAEIKLPDKKS